MRRVWFLLLLAIVTTSVTRATSVLGQSFEAPFDGPTVVLDEYSQPYIAVPHVEPSPFDNPWGLVALPEQLIYRAYLAGIKESRMGVQLINRQYDGVLLDGTLGGRFGVLRLGPSDQPL
ncbi:MAG: hypothetical protein HYV60_01270, partial [Planctomycetia bacterium]|nr:hypothetical protein [Planctomycetia bacterium]